MAWLDTLKAIAPTVATVLGGPLAGTAVAALASILGASDQTQDAIGRVLQNGGMTPDQLTEIRKLELQYQNDEKERDFRYADLAFRDVDSARKANVGGGTQVYLFWLSILLLTVCLGAEITVLFWGIPANVADIVAGRVLGLLDSVALLVLGYWYGTSVQHPLVNPPPPSGKKG